MKKLLPCLFILLCFQGFAQKPPKLKPLTATQLEQQKKVAEMQKKKETLLNATLTRVTLWINGITPGGCRYATEINHYFNERKFVMYAGSKGVIVTTSNFDRFGGTNGQEIYTFIPSKTILYKDMINQNISFNMDLTKPICDFFKYRDLSFSFTFSDDTMISVYLPGNTSYETTYGSEKEREVHVSRYLPGNAIPDPNK